MMTITAERTDFAAARKAMIDSQLRTSGVNAEWLLAAMARLPREDYVPAAARGHAYIDRAIPLDAHHALPAPAVHGMMLEEAGPVAADNVLIVSCGSDYLAALVRPLVASVAVVSAADAAAQTKGTGRFSLVLIDGAVEHLPAGLADEVAEGGRIVTGFSDRGVTRIALGRKLGGAVSLLPVADVGIPVLPEFAAPKSWSF